MRCRSCAARNPVGYTYCLACGARVRRDTFWPRSPEPIWQRSYCLVRMEDVTGQDQIGTGYPLDVLRQGGRALTIGRDEDCEIVLDHPSVSPRHAWMIRHGDGYLIEDAESAGGTFVNEKSFPRARRLHLRDTVRVGDCQLVYALSDPICPYCHTTDTLVTLDGVRSPGQTGHQDERQDGATGPAAPTHACHQCGREFWIVGSKWVGWWRRWQWRSQMLRRLLAARRGRSRPMLP